MGKRRRKKKRRGAPSSIRVACYLLLAVLTLLLWRRLDPIAPSEPGLASEIEALARVIRSEIGIGTATQQLHVAWAVRNLSVERRQTIVEMACTPCGRQGPARPVSSVQKGRAADRELAAQVLRAKPWADPTGGATRFINPRLQRKLSRGKRHRSYRRVRRRWIQRYGWEPYYRLGPTLEMWGVKRNKVSGSPARQ